MSSFDEDTQVTPLAGAPEAFVGVVNAAWNIGANPNGGYLVALVRQSQNRPEEWRP